MTVLTAAALLGAGLRAEQEYFVPALEDLEPVGSNPKANQMTPEEFEAYTESLQAQHDRWVETYEPDYSSSEWMLEPPLEGRLDAPLPLARGGVAAAEIIADFSPALHTPEATLGREDYPAEVFSYRHAGHYIVSNAVVELKTWLDTLTGADFPVRSEPTDGERTRIYVGANFAREHFAADLAELGRGDALDGFAVRARGGDVYIFGATAKGTMNGAYAFVENNSDLIWANRNPDIGTVYTVNPDLAVVWADALEKPGTVLRGWLKHGPGNPSFRWMMRNRNNLNTGQHPHVTRWGCWREAGGHMLGTFMENHVPDPKRFFPWIPDPETGELKQPERIRHYHHNICLTHPDQAEAYADAIVSYTKRDREERRPEAPFVGLKLGMEDPPPNRNYGLCMCERCQLPIKLPDGREIPVQRAAGDRELTFRSTQFYLLLEYIARALEAEYPLSQARLSTFAYYFAIEPPPFQTRVQPWFAPYHGGGGGLPMRDYRLPMFGRKGANQFFWNHLHGWSRITDQTIIYEYLGLGRYDRPFVEILAWDLRAMVPMGIRRFSSETNLKLQFLHMDYWVANRLYWNPDADVEQLKKYFLRRAYREGAPAMERFYNELRKWWYTEATRSGGFDPLSVIVKWSGMRETLREYLEEARATVRHPVAKANLEKMKL